MNSHLSGLLERSFCNLFKRKETQGNHIFDEYEKF